MIRALALILSLQLVGETIAEASGLPVPGPVIGMGLLLLILVVRGGPSPDLARTADGFLDNLGLLFVPAGVGVTLHLRSAQDDWAALAAAILVATPIAIVATALVFRALDRTGDDAKEPSTEPQTQPGVDDGR